MRIPAFLLCVALLCFARSAAEARETLTGRWQVVSIVANGEPREDEEITGSVWSFDPPRLTIREANGRETTYNFVPDGGYLEVMTPFGEQGWMKYELSGTSLRVAFYDNLKGKPASFDPEPGRKDPLLVVVHFTAVQ